MHVTSVYISEDIASSSNREDTHLQMLPVSPSRSPWSQKTTVLFSCFVLSRLLGKWYYTRWAVVHAVFLTALVTLRFICVIICISSAFLYIGE